MDKVLYDSHGFEYEMDVVNHDLNTPTIYVAGDLLSEGAKMRREWEAEQLRSAGANLHVPHEDKSINDKANAVQEGLAERIVSNDTQGIIDSDIIVIDAHENGKGTLVELGQIKGMKDVAKSVMDAVIAYDTDVLSAETAMEAVAEIAERVLAKRIYAHNTDIRRANDKPQAGDRREYGPNQYVYGTVLDLTDGVGFYDWDEIIEEVKELCE